MSFDWTDERIATLKTMWADGTSSSEIAYKLGDVSRSAVMGKVHRLGMKRGKEGRGHGGAPQAVRAAAAAISAKSRRPQITLAATAKPLAPTWSPKDIVRPKPVRTEIPAGSHIDSRSIDGGPEGEADTVALPKPAPVASGAGPHAKPLTIMQLRDKHCRWPLWDRERPTPHASLFCGAPTDGGSWCEHHRKICTEPAQPARRAA